MCEKKGVAITAAALQSCWNDSLTAAWLMNQVLLPPPHQRMWQAVTRKQAALKACPQDAACQWQKEAGSWAPCQEHTFSSYSASPCQTSTKQEWFKNFVKVSDGLYTITRLFQPLWYSEPFQTKVNFWICNLNFCLIHYDSTCIAVLLCLYFANIAFCVHCSAAKKQLCKTYCMHKRSWSEDFHVLKTTVESVWVYYIENTQAAELILFG